MKPKQKKNQFCKIKSLNGIILFKKAIKDGTCHLGLLIWTLYNSTFKRLGPIIFCHVSNYNGILVARKQFDHILFWKKN